MNSPNANALTKLQIMRRDVLCHANNMHDARHMNAQASRLFMGLVVTDLRENLSSGECLPTDLNEHRRSDREAE